MSENIFSDIKTSLTCPDSKNTFLVQFSNKYKLVILPNYTIYIILLAGQPILLFSIIGEIIFMFW
jgi:hypothetical protein